MNEGDAKEIIYNAVKEIIHSQIVFTSSWAWNANIRYWKKVNRSEIIELKVLRAIQDEILPIFPHLML